MKAFVLVLVLGKYGEFAAIKAMQVRSLPADHHMKRSAS